jgi:hypothetical protein
MGLEIDALSNLNISIVFFIILPSLIGGIALLVTIFTSKASPSPQINEQLPTN